MFNPFKKKEKEFKLDDISLPSLNETTTNNNYNDNLNSNNDEFNNNNFNNNNPISNNLSSSNSFNSIANTTPTFSNNTGFNNNNDASIQINNDIITTKIESLNNKLTLTNAKIDNIEQKLEIIYRMMIEEVSDDTKKKLNVENMMNSIRR